MSVPSQIPYNSYTANGLTTVFPYEFYILDSGDISVSVDDEDVIAGYSVAGAGNVAGGEITFLTPPAAGVTVLIQRDIPRTRLTDYQDNGDLLADTVNNDLDRLWMAVQQAFTWVGNQALMKPSWFASYYDAKGNKIANMGDPTNSQDATTKKYVDNKDAILQTNINAEANLRLAGDAAVTAYASKLFYAATHYQHGNDANGVYAENLGVKADGTDCGAAFDLALEFIMSNGGTLILPPGVINLGTTRISKVYSPGYKKHRVVGFGTKIIFANINPPTIDTTTKNWGSETALFSFVGNSNVEYMPEMVWEGVTFDYSNQANKGGNTLDTLGVCHPTPYSVGCRVFFIRYAMKPTFLRCTFQNVYGDGFWLRNCTQPLINYCCFFDVSANQILGRLSANMSLDSSGGCVFQQSCYGGSIEKNICWNTRKYKVSVLSPDTGVDMNGSLCGYIGLWCEYGLDADSYPAPLVDWTTAGSATDPALGCVIADNIVYGYCLGIKTESRADALIRGNIVRNCWKSISVSGTHTTVTNNWCNVTGSVSGKAPQGGFESSRGAISFGDATGQAPGTILTNHGCVASENFIEVENTPAFSTAQDNVKFFNNHCAYTGTSNGTYSVFLVTDTARRRLTIENNYFIISSNAVPVTQNFTQCNGLVLRGNYFYNKSSTRWAFSVLSANIDVLFDNNQFRGPIVINLAGVRSRYINNIHELEMSNLRMLTLSGVDSIAQGNTFNVNQATTEAPIYLSSSRLTFADNNLVIASAATNNVNYMVSVTSSSYSELHILRNKLIGNNGNQSLMRGNGMGNSVVSYNWTDSTSASLIQQNNICVPPMYCEGNTFGGGIVTGADPNALSRLGNMAVTPYIGMEVKYLVPGSGGYRGAVYTSSGWVPFGAVS